MDAENPPQGVGLPPSAELGAVSQKRGLDKAFRPVSNGSRSPSTHKVDSGRRSADPATAPSTTENVYVAFGAMEQRLYVAVERSSQAQFSEIQASSRMLAVLRRLQQAMLPSIPDPQAAANCPRPVQNQGMVGGECETVHHGGRRSSSQKHQSP
ncbi:hypothetical protein BDW59DRAFT_167055 [Aspergillus cavernicola]|uniref:Uncharacterized protein n=1 Tax=Aspergillus cavernicola TaxID=176166 RepID=A0ABR4HGT6_9EURO